MSNPEQSTDSAFSVPAVDPFVYRKSDDAPELRVSAADLPQFRDVAPIRRRFENLVRPDDSPDYDASVPWVPGGVIELDPPAPSTIPTPTVSRRSVEFLLATGATVLPLALIFAVVVFVYRWFGFA